MRVRRHPFIGTAFLLAGLTAGAVPVLAQHGAGSPQGGNTGGGDTGPRSMQDSGESAAASAARAPRDVGGSTSGRPGATRSTLPVQEGCPATVCPYDPKIGKCVCPQQ